MSAYSDWKCGAISDEEYDDYCRWEEARERALEEAEYEEYCRLEEAECEGEEE